MKLIKTLFLSAILLMSMTTLALANSGPIVVEEGPAFSISPEGSTAISVKNEYLEFDMSKASGNTAKVTAVYEMKNTSKEAVEQKMLFPFVTSNSKNFISSVRITKDGKPVDFKTFRLVDIPEVGAGVKHNFKENANAELSATLKMDNIIKMLNQNNYLPKNYNENQTVKVYTLHLPLKDKEYEAQVEYKLDPKKHKLIYGNVNGSNFNKDGSGKFIASVPSKFSSVISLNAFFVVLGDSSESKAVLKSSTGQELTVEEKTIGEFLTDYIANGNPLKGKIGDTTNLRPYTIKQLDVLLGRNEPLVSIYESVISSFSNPYIGAFLYSVDFEAESSKTVKVEYEMQATRDRSVTKNYSNLFLYLLRPAEGWKEFGGFIVKVIPSENMPYIIESSLPLVKDISTGIYNGQFSNLPEKDFYFVTYYTDQPDPPIAAALGRKQSMFHLLPSLLALIALVGVIAVILRVSRKRNC